MPPGEACLGQRFGVTGKAEPGAPQLVSQVVGLAKAGQTDIAGDTVGRSGEQRKIVRLARVSNAVRAGHVGALPSEPVEIRRSLVADHTGVIFVLEHHDHDVVWPWHSWLLLLRSCGHCGRLLGDAGQNGARAGTLRAGWLPSGW